jgi:hypothetical protein
MQLLILCDGVYNDERNQARARAAGELHVTLPNYGMTLIASGLAMSILPVVQKQPVSVPPPDVTAPVLLDLRDGVSDQEARAAGQALKQRRKRK